MSRYRRGSLPEPERRWRSGDEPAVTQERQRVGAPRSVTNGGMALPPDRTDIGRCQRHDV